MMTWAVCVLVILPLVVIVAVSVYGSLEIVKIPFLAVPYVPEDFGLSHEDVSFTSHDALKLTGWFLPAKVPSSVTADRSSCGLGSNAGDMLLNTICLARDGAWNLFYFNFRGHADSQGHLTSLGPLELRDLESALWLSLSKRSPKRRAVLESLRAFSG